MWITSIAQVLALSVAGVNAAQQPASAEPLPTRQTYFSIPFEIDQINHPVFSAVEIQLHVSTDRGATWQHHGSVTPETRHFLFRAAADGEYWFMVRTRDRAGNLRPPQVTEPGLRVVVDTTPPELALEAQRGEAGEIRVRWHLNEPNLKLESLNIQYRVGNRIAWETVAIDANQFSQAGTGRSGEVSWWPPAGGERVEIRAEAADTAGNRNVSHAQVGAPAGSYGSIASAPTASGPNTSAAVNDSVWRPARENRQPWDAATPASNGMTSYRQPSTTVGATNTASAAYQHSPPHSYSPGVYGQGESPPAPYRTIGKPPGDYAGAADPEQQTPPRRYDFR